MPSEKTNNDEHASEINKISTAEWVVAIASAIIVLGVVGFLIYDAIQGNGNPPNLGVSIEEIVENENAFMVVFDLFNYGDETAADVTIEGTLSDGETVIESHTATIDYVPPQSHRGGGIIFRQNPEQFTLDLRATAFRSP